MPHICSRYHFVCVKTWSSTRTISLTIIQRCQQDNEDEDTTHIGVGPGGDFQANNNLFDNLITGDETWVHLNTPETKRDSMTWKHPSSPVTKKFKVQRSAAKVMATVFWDAKGMILLDILPQANLTQQWLQCYGWEILPHPAHSPDLAPSDFHLFGPSKRHLGGMAFETEDDLISELRNWFDNLDVDFFRVGINSLLSRWQKLR
ncbi:histone-lysine N-methyltransferase SETMAR [Plakobranchus ocellatus]|uniref:Histone-lysine N-methyltransferase SETMAR n=1 Tax=Plakobranchus ocellatus TaxID=259542 RepID=A0AAV4C0V0_9GAST|nr:histone-lysine N-methyltransferase SETMAR [Plakobranchus ocellatus]